MKKTLIAMAAIAAMGAASAEMTIYGVVDLGLSSTSGSASNIDVSGFMNDMMPTKNVDQGAVITSGNYSGSRFGFKGSTDLGGGLKGSFMMETGFDAANGSVATFGGRGASAAVSGSFGTVSLGRQFSPYSMASWNEPLEYDGFSTLYYAWQAHGWHQEAFWHSKSIMYTTPTVNGLNASVMYANNGDATGATMDGDVVVPAQSATTYTSVGVNYATGPLTFAFGQETNKVHPTMANMGRTDTTAWQASVAYNAGVATLYVGFEGAQANTLMGVTGKDTGWNLGANVGLGEGMALQLGYGTEKSTLDGEEMASMWDQTVTATSVVFTRELNKSTRMYAGLTSTKVDSAILTEALGGSQTTTTTAIGIRYGF